MTAQFFVSIEVLASTAVMAGICLIAVVVIGRRSLGSHLGFAGTGAMWGVGVAAVLLAYPVWFVLRGPGYISGPVQLIPQAYRADLLGPIIPGLHQWLSTPSFASRSNLFANSTSENGSYLGVTLLATLVIGSVFLWRKSRVARVAAIGCASAFVISLGAGLVISGKPSASATGVPLPERLLTHIPALSNTVPVRYSLYVVLFAAVLLDLVIDELHRRLMPANTTQHVGDRRPVLGGAKRSGDGLPAAPGSRPSGQSDRAGWDPDLLHLVVELTDSNRQCRARVSLRHRNRAQCRSLASGDQHALQNAWGILSGLLRAPP